MSDQSTRRYLVVLLLGDVNVGRLRDLVPWLQRQLTEMSNEKIQLAFNSANRDEFGYFLRTSLKARQILSRLEGPTLTNADNVLIIEIGEDFAGSGRSRAWAWLQHH